MRLSEVIKGLVASLLLPCHPQGGEREGHWYLLPSLAWLAFRGPTAPGVLGRLGQWEALMEDWRQEEGKLGISVCVCAPGILASD